MSTRQIKNARDLTTNELIYFRGHAKATYMSDGATVEDTINNIKNNGGGSSNTNNTYITDFTIEELRSLVNGNEQSLSFDVDSLKNALINRQTILVPISKDTESYFGCAGILVGYFEDLLYLSVYDEHGGVFIIETNHDTGVILYEQIKYNRYDPNSIKIIDETCKIYYTGIIDESLLPTTWGNAKLLGHRKIAHAYSEGTTTANYIRSLIFDNPVEVIPQQAFSGQTNLNSIYLPPTVLNVSHDAFTNCVSLNYIDARFYSGSLKNYITGVNSRCIVISAYVSNSTELSGVCHGFTAENYAPSIGVVKKPTVHRNGLITAVSNVNITSGYNMVCVPNYITKYTKTLPTTGSVNIAAANNSGIVFTMGSTACTIAINGTWSWVNGITPVFEANKTYEISFYDGRAVCVSY